MLLRVLRSALLTVVSATIFVPAIQAQAGDPFAQWPEGYSPYAVGEHLANHFVTSPHQYTGLFTILK